MAIGAWALVPPVVAIVLAIVTRRVHASLLAGIFTAGVVAAWPASGGPLAPAAALGGAFLQAGTWTVDALSIRANAAILAFVTMLGGIVALMRRSGGMAAVAERGKTLAATPRRLQVVAWATGGTVLSIDDHFNAVTAGTMFRPLADTARVSREKLAYIVDSTAAPVAIVMPMSTWAGFMVAFTASALASVDPAADAFGIFLGSILHNHYAWATLAFVLVVALGRDFGPMAQAEARARRGVTLRRGSRLLADDGPAPPRGTPRRLRNVLLPLLWLFASLVLMLWVTGGGGRLTAALARADAPLALLLATASALLFSIFLPMAQGLLRADDAVESALLGFRSMLPAVVVLTLAFTMGVAVTATGLGAWTASALGGSMPASLVPVLAFLVAALTAFATGTSFGTYAIMIPVALQVTAAMPDAAYWYAPVLAAVAGGGVFGDHCSPISDTTILSSMAAGCDHIDHVRTQLPYAVLVAGIATAAYLALAWDGTAAAWTVTGLLLALSAIVPRVRRSPGRTAPARQPS